MATQNDLRHLARQEGLEKLTKYDEGTFKAFARRVWRQHRCGVDRALEIYAEYVDVKSEGAEEAVLDIEEIFATVLVQKLTPERREKFLKLRGARVSASGPGR